MLRQESGVAGIEMSVEAPGPGPVLQGLRSRGGRGAGKAGKVAAQVNPQDWQGDVVASPLPAVRRYKRQSRRCCSQF